MLPIMITKYDTTNNNLLTLKLIKIQDLLIPSLYLFERNIIQNEIRRYHIWGIRCINQGVVIF